MNEIYSSSTKNLSNYDIETAIDKLLQQYDNLRKILIIPPDFTRCFSKAGDITQIIYKKLSTNVKIDIMPALGTHAMINDEERIKMYGDIPKANFLHHKWQSDTIKIGEVPKDFVAKISNNLFNDTIDVEVYAQITHNGKAYPIASLPDNLVDILNAGGLVKAMRKLNGLD